MQFPPQRKPIDFTRLLLGLICIAWSIPFYILGYRIPLCFPLAVGAYLILTSCIGRFLKTKPSSAKAVVWRSVRLVLAIAAGSYFTAGYLNSIYTGAPPEPTNFYLFLIPSTALFIAIIYRYPWIAQRGWTRHVIAPTAGIVSAVIWFFCLLFCLL